MVQAGIGGLDTPRTNIGDATYLTNPPLDFDISQEQSFQSPSKDGNNLLQQLQNGRRGAINLKTPRSRVALSDRRNLLAALGGGEFTPLLKSATRNSALRSGKENISQAPAFPRLGGLSNIPEDFSPLPVMASSIMYGEDSRNGSYMAGTPIPHIDSSSTASTPMAMLPRRTEGPGVLQDGNQLSLREQENVIDKIEKENFGLKLKIHFLEEALRKAGPGFSEAALKENTELKVDKVTMQRELQRFRKTLTAAERDVELYRQQILEMQEKVKRKHADEGQREEIDRLRQTIEDQEAELDRLRSRQGQFDDLQDKIHDLEADVREKDRTIGDQEDEVDNLKDEVEKHKGTISDLEDTLKQSQRRAVELEEMAQSSDDLADAKETIEDLERNMERLKNEIQDARDDREEAIKEKDRVQSDLEELQDEMANKSIMTKGLSRQIEEKANRFQTDLEGLRDKYRALEEQHADKSIEVKKLNAKIENLQQDAEIQEEKLKNRLDVAQKENKTAVFERDHLLAQVKGLQTELQSKVDEKDLLQIRHDALTSESASLQKEISKFRKEAEDLEDKLGHEKTLSLNNDREVRDQYKGEIDRLNDEIDDLQVKVRERERLYDDDSDKWESERRNIESQRDSAETEAAGLRRTIEKLQEAEGTLSGKEMKLHSALQSEKDRHESQEAILTRQISELNEDVDARRKALDEVRSELSDVREELRSSQRKQQSLEEKIEGLEDEVEVLQTTLEDERDHANQKVASVNRESENLRAQLQSLQRDAQNAETALFKDQNQSLQDGLQTCSKEQLISRLTDVETQLAKVRQDKQVMHDKLASLNIEAHSLRTSRAETEAERDEIKSQLRAMKEQEDETFRLDQERVDLRTAKMKLDGEVRRLREENKMAANKQQVLEDELRQEIDRAGDEENRLNSEIRNLQNILRGSAEKKELVAAKNTIRRLEERLLDLESQNVSSHGQPRNKNTELGDSVGALKRQLADMKRKAHNAEISIFSVQSPHSVGGSTRKAELIQVRHQLAAAHQTLKDLRAQLKSVEREASCRVNEVQIDLQSRADQWESERAQMEQSLAEAKVTIKDLSTQNSAFSETLTRQRGKVDRLEKALQAERLNSGEDRTMALERRDLHDMLRETQLQAESLEIIVQERESTIAAIRAAESDLRAQLKRVRDDRTAQRSRAASAHEQLDDMERKFRKLKEGWEEEKKALSRGVRFANMSLSVNDESGILTLRKEAEERETRHVKELRGLAMQIEWLRAKCQREEGLRANAAYAKKFMLLQIALFEACNKADLQLLQQMGITPPQRTTVEKKPTLRTVAFLIVASVRMKKGAEQWAKSRKIHERLVSSLEVMKRKARRSSGVK